MGIFNFRNLAALLRCYGTFLILFILQKPVFLLYHWGESAKAGLWNCAKVIWHGIPMDIAVAGYATLLPLLLLWVCAWWRGSERGVAKLLRIYFIVASILITVIFIPDLELYTAWGFRIDATIFNYLSNPQGAAASVPGWLILVGVGAIAVVSLLQYILLSRTVATYLLRKRKPAGNKLAEAVLFPLCAVVMFVGIRGGLTASTMNVSKVYFSDNMYLNHAAINPCFNLLSSLSRMDDLKGRYHFMDDAQAEEIFAKMMAHSPSDSLPKILSTQRPNIVFILLESFGKPVLDRKDVTPRLNEIAAGGILFNNMYASSFRTDRGLVASLSGFPGQPTMSILKYPSKAQHLPSLPASLRGAGYKDISFLYGGDVNFAFIKSYFVSQGVTDITADTDFPAKQQKESRWGVYDHHTFPYLLEDIRSTKEEPYAKFFINLNSHEPFDVPMHRFDDGYLNSVAYADSCLGAFVDELKQLPSWKNTLLVLVPDHNMRYPHDIPVHTPERFGIFAVLAGGAVASPQVVSTVCAQTDLAATLLAQLGIDQSGYAFSKNILDPSYLHYAFFSQPDTFGIVDRENKTVFDCAAKKTLLSEGPDADSVLLCGKAYLQHLYNVIAEY